MNNKNEKQQTKGTFNTADDVRQFVRSHTIPDELANLPDKKLGAMTAHQLNNLILEIGNTTKQIEAQALVFKAAVRMNNVTLVNSIETGDDLAVPVAEGVEIAIKNGYKSMLKTIGNKWNLTRLAYQIVTDNPDDQKQITKLYDLIGKNNEEADVNWDAVLAYAHKNDYEIILSKLAPTEHTLPSHYLKDNMPECLYEGCSANIDLFPDTQEALGHILIYHANNGDIKKVKKTIKAGADPGYKLGGSIAAAIENNDIAMFKYLLGEVGDEFSFYNANLHSKAASTGTYKTLRTLFDKTPDQRCSVMAKELLWNTQDTGVSEPDLITEPDYAKKMRLVFDQTDQLSGEILRFVQKELANTEYEPTEAEIAARNI